MPSQPTASSLLACSAGAQLATRPTWRCDIRDGSATSPPLGDTRRLEGVDRGCGPEGRDAMARLA